jgi:DNA polymerase
VPVFGAAPGNLPSQIFGADVPILHRDFETRSTIDLPDVGAWRYAAEPTTDIWCCAYAVDDGPVKLWLPGQPIPEEFQIAARDPDWVVAAHNDQFETAIETRILAPRYGWPIVPIERHRCTMAMASASALPAKLKTVAEVLELSARKDDDGGRLMKQMARPRMPRAGEDPNGIYWHDEPEKLERLYAYCRQDVEVERELFHRLPALTDDEHSLWVLDQTINSRGFYTDGPLLDASSRIAAEAGQATQDELARITDGALTSTDQVAGMLSWLGDRGCKVQDLKKPTLGHALRRKNLDPVVRRVIELRLGAAHAAAAKVDALRAWRDDDGRVRGTLRFHGAGTGRWTGSGPQPQNFKRDGENIEAKRVAISTGDLGHVQTIYPQPLEVVGDIARAMICAAPGHRFLIGDFSGVESRVLAWVSGQQSKLDQWSTFDRTGDLKDEPYFMIGRGCGRPEDNARAIGKTADLAFGYMGGPGAWDRLAPDDDTSTEDDKRRYQKAWRRLHPQTEKFWGSINRAAIQAVRKAGEVFTCRQLTFIYDGEFLRITLPSGRALSYPSPRLSTGKFGDTIVIFKDSAAGKWVDCRFGQGAYGGLWAENIVQAVSRDLLAAAMQRLEAAGYSIVLHVHDEIVAEAPDGFGSVEEFTRLITALPAWAEGLPVAAKVRNGPRFAKSEKPSALQYAFSATSPQNDAAVDDEGDDRARNSSIISTDIPPWEDQPMDKEEPKPAAAQPIDDIIILDMPHIDLRKILAAPTLVPDVAPRAASKANGHDRRQPGDYTSPTKDTGKEVAFFTYQHVDGRPHLGVKKTSTKQFPQYHWNGDGWAKGAPEGPKIPYRLPELIKAPLDELVIIAAGEKDADTAAGLGFVSTTNSEGERKGAWAPELNAWFAGRKRVAIMEDNDSTGRAHVLEVANGLRSIVSNIRIVTFRDLPEHGDLTDWITLGGRGRDDLLAKIEATKPTTGDINIMSKADFLSGFIPPDYLIDGILQRRFIYSLTGQTGHAKTAIALRLAQLVDEGGSLDGHEVTRGRVAYLVGENPDDVRMRVIADDATIGHSGKGNIIFVPGVFDTDGLLQKIESLGELDFLIVDTSAAYFLGDDENDNPAMGEHARKLRRLISLPGGPSGLVLCHPIKHAAEPAQLLPRGGGAFLAEVDGNLTAWKDDKLITFHHSDKFRGPGFEPITFRLDKVTVDALKDSKGRMIPTVRAVVISEDEQAQEAETTRRDEDLILVARYEGARSMSLADLAEALDWTLADGRPYKSKVQRALNRLKLAGLMKPQRGKWDLTSKGEDVARDLGGNAEARERNRTEVTP